MVAISGKAVEAQWHDIWAVAVAVTGMCVVKSPDSNGRGGIGTLTGTVYDLQTCGDFAD